MSDDIDSGFGINSIKVKDNSVATVASVGTTLSKLPSINPGFSSDGKDNKIVEISDTSDLYSKFGDDFANFKLYGQQNLNLLHTLEGGGKGYFCRLMPNDAVRAGIMIRVGVKAVEDIPLYKRDVYGDYVLDENEAKIRLTATQTVSTEVEQPDGSTVTQNVETQVPASVSGLRIKLFAESISSTIMNNNKNLEKMANVLNTVTEDTETGYTIYPLMCIAYYAHGACGGNYGVYLNNDLSRDDRTGDGRRYQMYLVKKTSSGVITQDYGNGISFSFNPDALISQYGSDLESLKVIYSNEDSSNNERPMQIFSYEDRYSEMISKFDRLLQNDVVATTGFDADYTFRTPESGTDFDFINGIDKDGYTYDIVDFDTASQNLSQIHYLLGGSDGSFETLTGTELETAKETLLTSFFNCDIDTANIINVLQCDGAIIYDANYSMPIKKAMTKIVKFRRDVSVVYDCKDTDSFTEAVSVAKTIAGFVPSSMGENFAIVPHFGVTMDRTPNVRVSATYEMAYGLARLYKTSPFGIYAGKPNDAGCVRTMKFDWVVEEGKPVGYNEKLAKTNRLYYAIDLGKAVSTLAEGNITGRNVYFYSNSNLYGTKLSKLSEFRNGLLINDVRRVLKLTLVKYTFDNDGATASIEKAVEDLTKIFSTRYPSNAIITLSLYQTSRDKILNQATCDVTVTFPDIFESWNCTIIAARNSVSETNTTQEAA